MMNIRGGPRIYLSLTTLALSLFWAFLLIQESPLLVAYYLLSACVMIATTLFMMTRRPHLRLRSSGARSEDESRVLNDLSARPEARLGSSLFFIVAVMAFLLIISLILEPVSWIIVLIGITSGISVADLVSYLYGPKPSGTITGDEKV